MIQDAFSELRPSYGATIQNSPTPQYYYGLKFRNPYCLNFEVPSNSSPTVQLSRMVVCMYPYPSTCLYWEKIPCENDKKADFPATAKLEQVLWSRKDRTHKNKNKHDEKMYHRTK